MLCSAADSALVIIDIQERLAPAIHDSNRVAAAAGWLMDVAAQLQVPIHLTEQYPKGLGPTVSALRTRADAAQIHQKMHFSWWREGNVADMLTREQVVLTGTEAHVCVLQTALDLAGEGYDVFVVEDAVGSRRPADKQRGLERMRAAGCTIVTREMVAFEWLEKAGTDAFRAVQPMLREGIESPRRSVSGQSQRDLLG
ncbi:MAG: isochorismatase family protein [Bacteroidetes bacterium]|jgi:nicotinamidase-related amidase|nr:isochorismatase family protein [Bacteroidota bacterium]